MFESSGPKKARAKFAVEVELDDGTTQILFIFVSPGNRVIDMLNDDRAFLPFETGDGSIEIYKKTAIRRISPMFAAEKITSSDPYGILGVGRDVSDAEIHAAYRRAVATVHPDHVQSLGLPEEFVHLATRRAMAINSAYDRIKRERNGAAAASASTAS
jgi:hypothetical protein